MCSIEKNTNDMLFAVTHIGIHRFYNIGAREYGWTAQGKYNNNTECAMAILGFKEYDSDGKYINFRSEDYPEAIITLVRDGSGE